jgi:hypothetical protein
VFGARPLLVAAREAALEESLSHLGVELRALPVGLREAVLGLALGALDGEEQPATHVGLVLEVGRFAQPPLERVLADAAHARGGATGGAAVADERARLVDERVGQRQGGSAAGGWYIGILVNTHGPRSWVFVRRL